MTEKNVTTKIFWLLGGIGLVVHVLILLWNIFHGGNEASGWPLRNLNEAGAFSFLGGLFYALFLRYPVTQCIRERKISLPALLKGGLGGVLATTLAFQGRYLLEASFLTYKMNVGHPEVSLKAAFLFAVMDIESYGIILVFYFAIPAFLCGALATGLVARALIHSEYPQSSTTISPTVSADK